MFVVSCQLFNMKKKDLLSEKKTVTSLDQVRI